MQQSHDPPLSFKRSKRRAVVRDIYFGKRTFKHIIFPSVFPSKVNRGPVFSLVNSIGCLHLILFRLTACRLRYPLYNHLTSELTYAVGSGHAV